MPDLAFVLLRGESRPSPEKIAAAATAMGFAFGLETGEGQITLVMAKGAQLIVSHVPFAHPDAAHMPLGILTPQAKEIAASRGHLIVAALGLVGPTQQRELQMAVLTACVVEGCDAVAAMLGRGVTFHAASDFVEIAKAGAAEGELPIELTVDVTLAREPDGRASFLTHGLRRYGREEFFITTRNSASDALDLIYGMSRWMLAEPGKMLPTGDTVGRTPSEKMRVQRVRNPTGSDDTVIRLDMPG